MRQTLTTTSDPFSHLDNQHYFVSLIQHAYHTNRISEHQITQIQAEIMQLLALQQSKWLGDHSSSIAIEDAQELLNGIFYVMGVALKVAPTPEAALSILQEQSIGTLFHTGQQQIQIKISQAQLIHAKIKQALFETPNVFYHSTIIDGIQAFFKLYQPAFFAHHTHITLDYPVFKGRPSLDGIELIEAYLQCIDAENTFCLCFQPSFVHRLMRSLSHSYPNIPLNLFEPVLLSALALTICHHRPLALDLSTRDLHIISQHFAHHDQHEIQKQLTSTFFVLNQTLQLPAHCRQYILQIMPKLADIVKTASELKMLDKVFLLPDQSTQHISYHYSYTFQMTQTNYQNLLCQIKLTDDSTQRVNAILKNCRSLPDLLDLLAEIELSPTEIESLIWQLPESAYMALLLQYPTDAFLTPYEKNIYRALRKRKTSS